MTQDLRELVARRERLVSRSTQLRGELGAEIARLRRGIGAIDAAVLSVRRLARYKTPIGIAAGIVLIAAPKASARWVVRLAWILPIAAEGYRLSRALRAGERPRA